jgi:hypothetical protein
LVVCCCISGACCRCSISGEANEASTLMANEAKESKEEARRRLRWGKEL